MLASPGVGALVPARKAENGRRECFEQRPWTMGLGSRSRLHRTRRWQPPACREPTRAGVLLRSSLRRRFLADHVGAATGSRYQSGQLGGASVKETL